MRYGINFHPMKQPASPDDAATFKILRLRNLQAARLDVAVTYDTDATLVPRLQGIVALAKDNGVRLMPMLAFPFAWGDRTDHGQYPAGDSTALYNQGYNRTKALVTQFRNDITDWELGNELNLLVKDANGASLYGKGWTFSEFNTPLMLDWARVLKGASDAIDWVNATYGLALRRVLNTTSTMFGFLDFMIWQGVKFEVIDYHYYERETVNPNSYWANFTAANGSHVSSFNLFQKLNVYAPRTVVIGETNAAEVYDADYLNVEGDAKTEQGFRSLRNALGYFTTQTQCNIESIFAYELLDEPALAPSSESRFGLHTDLNTPKIPMFLLAQKAGGHCCAPETAKLSSRSL